jgi:hypothetical protein
MDRHPLDQPSSSALQLSTCSACFQLLRHFVRRSFPGLPTRDVPCTLPQLARRTHSLLSCPQFPGPQLSPRSSCSCCSLPCNGNPNLGCPPAFPLLPAPIRSRPQRFSPQSPTLLALLHFPQPLPPLFRSILSFTSSHSLNCFRWRPSRNGIPSGLACLHGTTGIFPSKAVTPPRPPPPP